jgi:hypothetical protein
MLAVPVSIAVLELQLVREASALPNRLVRLVWVSYFNSPVDRVAFAVRNRAVLSSRLYYYKLRVCSHSN